MEKEESVRAQLTVPYSEERILAIKSASSHGARFKATGGFTISGNEFFKAATLRNNEEEAKVVQADKKKRQECEKNENAALAILQNGQAIDNLKKAELEVLFAWHGIPKNEQGTNMKERTSKWRAIVASKKEAPSYQKWTDEEEQKLKNLHNVDVPMKDTAVGRLQALRRREAKLSLKTMTPEERKTFMDNIDSDSES